MAVFLGDDDVGCGGLAPGVLVVRHLAVVAHVLAEGRYQRQWEGPRGGPEGEKEKKKKEKEEEERKGKKKAWANKRRGRERGKDYSFQNFKKFGVKFYFNPIKRTIFTTLESLMI